MEFASLVSQKGTLAYGYNSPQAELRCFKYQYICSKTTCGASHWLHLSLLSKWRQAQLQTACQKLTVGRTWHCCLPFAQPSSHAYLLDLACNLHPTRGSGQLPVMLCAGQKAAFHCLAYVCYSRVPELKFASRMKFQQNSTLTLRSANRDA